MVASTDDRETKMEPAMAENQPDAVSVRRDERVKFDELRERCPVVPRGSLGWSVYRYRDVRRIVEDHETFSNAVSRHLSVPNGMDPPEHTGFRRAIEPYFAAERVSRFEPQCRRLAGNLSDALKDDSTVEFMDAYAGAFAAAVQCAFLGWPRSLEGTLRAWTARNQAATREGDRDRLAELAREFEAQVESLLAERREQRVSPVADVTAGLLHERVEGRPLRIEEIVSILRNWTVGEVGTIAAAVGILAGYLANHPDLQRQLRAEPECLPYAIDEILRLDGPLVANRRRTTCPVTLGGHRIAAEQHLSIVWIAANRDPEVFADPDEFRWDRDPADNLLYGAGIHVCPGASLARMELRVAMEELLRATTWIEPAEGEQARRAISPGAGFERLPLRVHRE
ncbi:cytochrome P450 [Halofilum ochraceum]|uniref:cytochrome P450 n=1 Tax=Halofilum ochraceum TaxID=1611323 RepID=UPI001C2F83C5|nr:cytochrome P450 [Halofilum ochraceum]